MYCDTIDLTDIVAGRKWGKLAVPDHQGREERVSPRVSRSSLIKTGHRLAALALLFLCFAWNAEADDLALSFVGQTPSNPVPFGQQIQYTVRTENVRSDPDAPLSAIGVGIEIRVNGSTVRADSGEFAANGCSVDPDFPFSFACNDLIEGGSQTPSFTWLNPQSGTSTVSFVGFCQRLPEQTPTDFCPSFGITVSTTTVVVGVPTANAGPDQTVTDADNDGSELVTLDGTGSSDPDGTITSYEWLEDGQQIATGVAPTVPFDVGVHTVTLRVTDNDGQQDTDTVEITVGSGALPTVIIEKVSGDGLSGSVGETLGFTIRVLDQGSPIENVSVAWSITPAQGGDLESSTTTTNASGETSNDLTINEAGVIRVRATIPGGTASVNFVVNSLADTPGLPPNEKALAEALDNACPALADKAELTAPEQDLLNTCNALVAGDPATVVTTLGILVPEQVTAQGTASIEAAEIQVMNVNTRLNALRAGQAGVDLSGLTFNIDGETLPASIFQELFFGFANGVAAGGEEGDASFLGKWGVFVNGAIEVGDKDSTSRETGFEFDSEGITFGVDYRFTDQFIAGGALGYSNYDSDFDSSAGDLDLEAWSMSAYATYYQSNQIYIDGLIQIGTNDYDTRRRINTSGNPDQFGVGDMDGQEFSISIGGGYEYNRKSFIFGPYGRLSYTRAEVDSYTEKASDPTAPGSGSVLHIGDQDIDSLTVVLGGHFSYAISTSRAVLSPQLRFEWEHEFSDDSRHIDSRFVHDPTSTSFKIDSDDPDRDFFNLGIGLSATFRGQKSAFVFYETKLGHDDIEHESLTAGMRFEF